VKCFIISAHVELIPVAFPKPHRDSQKKILWLLEELRNFGTDFEETGEKTFFVTPITFKYLNIKKLDV
jgi:hypothetical protein